MNPEVPDACENTTELRLQVQVFCVQESLESYQGKRGVVVEIEARKNGRPGCFFSSRSSSIIGISPQEANLEA